MKALSGHVIVEIIKPPEKVGSIFMPENQKQVKISKGKAVSVGEDFLDRKGIIWEKPCAVSDIVYFKQQTKAQIFSGKYLCIWFDDIVAVD